LLKTRKKTTAAIINSDRDFQELRRNLNPEFNALWQQGYQHYLNGEWPEAKAIFKDCLKLK